MKNRYSQKKSTFKKANQEILEKHNDIINSLITDNNYKNTYPIPKTLVRHKQQHPNSFYIQVLGARGAGKSTFINNLMRRLTRASLAVNFKYQKALTGDFECTLESQFIDITALVENIKPPYKNVFLVDQPGIGGRIILEADYLQEFGPGEYMVKS